MNKQGNELSVQQDKKLSKKAKTIIGAAIGVVIAALVAAGGWYVFQTQFAWVPIEDYFVGDWQGDNEAFVTSSAGMFDLTIPVGEPVIYFNDTPIPVRTGGVIRDGRLYVRAGDMATVTEFGNELEANDTSPPVIVIVNGMYGQGTAEDNAMVHALLGGNQARDRFEIYFQWYNGVHELGHAITQQYGTMDFDNMDMRHPVDEEILVNSFAIAYKMHYGEEERLIALEEAVEYITGNLEPPAQGAVPKDYLRQAIDEGRDDVQTFEIWGWFQFNIVRDILRERDSLDLEALLREMTGLDSIQEPPGPRPSFYYPSLGTDVVPEVLSDAVSVLKDWGIELPCIYVSFCRDPNNHSMQYPTSYVLIEDNVAAGRVLPIRYNSVIR